ncbi:glycoside hydrolase family 5 protein [Aetokthonos hydrillicola Thurmond2011]|jgi:endoglucanase|uniref:Endoglucanase n=1 Tax=Aetokthonos hydrillicola Thurmond2011 TaxID=2712845 RepID=A0AAP5I8I8_9CYAN|nr:glycoside hydrolase family 5 protein [Aetokthonos hydrillicola]MBO3462652.1 glycoside hydrolase family 5 protein [Aetokthonos hydrillicola CCALA 1050]MBW4589894.1 glycoside hydrolase family 5 protein [Aetokthonos hydrillicola CCALA 1050]MDR9896978.1 glycoside hydrolase family 5 protein [Aetokthonos hydrillicola Thurmond2011]
MFKLNSLLKIATAFDGFALNKTIKEIILWCQRFQKLRPREISRSLTKRRFRERFWISAAVITLLISLSQHPENLIEVADAASIRYAGVNLAGAEFGENVLPGTFNINYIYPSYSDVDYFVSKGMKIFRLPFRWERLQKQQFGNLDTDELVRIDDFVSYATGKGSAVLLDPHNYARYYGTVIGQGVPDTAFADFWGKLASRYKSNSSVIFGLMNEPNNMSTDVWRDDANKAIQAIRNSGATNLILVPGNAWSGAHSWKQSWYGTSNATAMLGITDPNNNYAFDVHQYLDSDYSGRSDQCVSSTFGSQNLVDFTTWLKQNNKRGFLSEFSGGNNNTCYDAMDKMLSYIDSNTDVWLGWTYWAAGQWWPQQSKTIVEPINGQDRPQMAILKKHIS